MKISTLFDEYEQMIAAASDTGKTFCKSKMVVDCNYGRLDKGFFPLGSGIFADKCKFDEAEINNCQNMVLGNDFGTITYATTLPNKRESDNNKTVYHLKRLPLDPTKTFYTNFYMGLRDDMTDGKVTMTSKIKREDTYHKFCFAFFQKQLDLIDPKLVLCLGKDVGKALNRSCPNIFPNYNKPFKDLLSDGQSDHIVLTDDKILGKRKFILIPHPSYAHINWKKGMKERFDSDLRDTI